MTRFKHRYVIYIAGILFLISFALPSYDGKIGLQCARISIEAMFKVLFEPEQFSTMRELLFTLYIGLFNITNVFSVFLLIKNSIHPDRYLPFIPRAFYGIVIFCTALWWFISLASGSLDSLGAGYYLWLLSIMILGAYNWTPPKNAS